MRRRFESVLVTGASSGIGRELVRVFARRGARVVALARRAERLDELAQEPDLAGRVVPLVFDVADVDALRRLVTELDHTHTFDLVIANAGVGLGAHARSLAFEDLERTLRVNLLAAAATLHAALPGMLARGRGTLCGVSSLAGTGGMPESGGYAASKAALSTLLETFAIDLAGSGVAVCDVQPGYVHTEMTADAGHALPFVWDVERAASHVADRIERGSTRIRFPWQVVLLLDVLKLCPRFVWRAVFGALARRA
jgi:short-subunit dehydrogenase